MAVRKGPIPGCLRRYPELRAGFAALCIALSGLTATAGPALAGDRQTTFEHWREHDEAATARIDHGRWARFLLRYLRPGPDGVNRIAYGDVERRHRLDLTDYLQDMQKVDIAAFRRSEQMAYWINLYNALTVDLVLHHYPIVSITRIDRSDLGPHGDPFDLRLIEIDGVSLSLNDIKNRVLQPIWNDPRVHYALSCSAIGCPNLQPTPYAGSRIDRQLSDAAMAFVNDPRCIRITDDKLHVSSLYRWNLRAFGGSERAVIQHLMAYAEPALAMSLQAFDHLDGDHFDWRLNDAMD